MTQVPYTFGTESSPIPLSQLDANFAVTPQYATTAGNVVNPIQSNITTVGTLVALSVTGNINVGNVRTTGSFSSYGNVTSGNVNTGGTISAYGDIVTEGRLSVGGALSANGAASVGNIFSSGNANLVGNITSNGSITCNGSFSTNGGNIAGANLTANGQISATGNITTQGNIASQGIISATGNIVTAANFVGNFLGNITGNISVGGSNTQVLFNNNGNVGAAGGLTYDSGSNTLGILGVVSAQGDVYGANLILSGSGNLTTGGNLNAAVNITAGGNLTIGGNIIVGGTTQLIGVATVPTAATATANNQVASTAFVNNRINQYANNVAITGGTITVNSVAATVVSLGAWDIKQVSGTLYFSYGGANVAKLDTAGNFTVKGNVTGFGTV